MTKFQINLINYICSYQADFFSRHNFSNTYLDFYIVRVVKKKYTIKMFELSSNLAQLLYF